MGRRGDRPCQDKNAAGLHGPLFYLSETCSETRHLPTGNRRCATVSVGRCGDLSAFHFGSGWTAANGWRGNTDLAERIRFDLDYIERWSLLFDFYIMLLTFTRNKNAY